jgi:hypothetical protein
MGPRSGGRDARSGPKQGASSGDYDSAADQLAAMMDPLGVAKAIVLPPPQIPNQNGPGGYSSFKKALDRHPGRLFFMAGGLELNTVIHGTPPDRVTGGIKADFEKTALALIQQGALGFGEMAALHLSLNPEHPNENVSPDHPLFLLLADVAAKTNRPIDLHMEAVTTPTPLPAGIARATGRNQTRLTANIPGLERLLVHQRGAKVVWQHIGWDNIGQMTPDLMRRLVRTHPNLYLAFRVEERLRVVGGDDRMPNRLVDPAGRIRPEWLSLIQEYSDRFMVGSDEFVCPVGIRSRYPESMSKTWAMVQTLPPDLAEKVGHTNAAQVYRLD